MPYRENYMDDPDKVRNWQLELKNLVRHSDLEAGDLRSSALMVIDIQKFFIEESSHACLPSAKMIIPNLNRLITAYTTRSLPVIFTRYAVAEGEDQGVMARWWRDIIKEGTDPAELYPELVVPENSPVIRKPTYDSFHNTDLKKILAEKNISTVVITGVMTHLCCETTARAAFVNGFYVYFVIDGNATMNEELHMASLKTLSDGFAVPCTTSELLEALNKSFEQGGDGA
ncbi:MAG: isochorismatase family protein [Thermoplasmata archaeon]|nr:MAG: isochorismatase family protein [Thermoplasmata archaeon]